jgi:hypothetical protein
MVPGARIALYGSQAKRFLQLDGDYRANSLKDDVKKNAIEAWRTYERFEVVDVGSGQIALFSPQHKRFLRLRDDGQVDADKETNRDADGLPFDWKSERFTVVDGGDGRVALHGTRANRFLRMTQDGGVEGGGRKDAAKLPPYHESASERFEVVAHPFAGQVH